MRLTHVFTALLVAGALAGCATLPPSQMSYATTALSPEATAVIAKDMADKAAQIVPPAKTTLVVSPPDQAQYKLGGVVENALRAEGYAVQDLPPVSQGSTVPVPKGIPFRYQITAADHAVLVRIEMARRLLARGYGIAPDNMSLAPSGPWSNIELPK